MATKHECVLPNALKIPALTKMAGKRIVLASASPRRKEILKTFGLDPEIVVSTFAENLPHDHFNNVYEYPVGTATEKAVEVYQQMLDSNPDDPPDLVIGADTVVLTKPTYGQDYLHDSLLPQSRPQILEKPISKGDNLRMLLDLNGGACEVVTGVSLVYPVMTAPGYEIRSLEERTMVHFSDNPLSILEAYVDSGEGIDRAGGFAVQELGAHLIRKIDGDFFNVVGFPGASFFKFVAELIDDDSDFLGIQ